MYPSNIRLHHPDLQFAKSVWNSIYMASMMIHMAVFGMQLQEAVQRGPYLVRKHTEATPVVMTAERF